MCLLLSHVLNLRDREKGKEWSSFTLEPKKRNVRKINISYLRSCVVTRATFLVMLQWSVTYTTNQTRKSPKYSDGHLHIVKQVGLNLNAFSSLYNYTREDTYLTTWESNRRAFITTIWHKLDKLRDFSLTTWYWKSDIQIKLR